MKTGETLFLIDDDADDRNLFRAVLEDFEAEVNYVTAVDGLDALQKLQSAELLPKLIVLDLGMPFMGGSDLLIELNKIERLKQVPVVIYSTSPFHFAKNVEQQIKVADTIEKPSTIDGLECIVRDLLQRYFPGALKKEHWALQQRATGS
ncbi:MAG: response regulator [Chitinophagales bacterium]